jgi:hypothetical protein
MAVQDFKIRDLYQRISTAQRSCTTTHAARPGSRSKTSYTQRVRFCQSLYSALFDTQYLAESFSRMSDMFSLAIYKRYISRLLEYNSAFFVIVNLGEVAYFSGKDLNFFWKQRS